MTSPSAPPDLSKLRINRDQPPAPLRRALRRNLAIGLVAVIIVAVVLLMGRGRAVPVQTALATPIASGGQPGSAEASVTWPDGRSLAALGMTTLSPYEAH